MSIYEGLGVRTVINAAAAQTALGGSLMPPPVLRAIHDAALSFLDVAELHDRIGERIATLTNNEAACITCGAAAGILVAVSAALTVDEPHMAIRLPDLTGLRKTEVVLFSAQRNGFLSAARESGATLVEVEGTDAALRQGISEPTAAVLWFAGPIWADGALTIEETISVAHERGVPVIVDAADQIPPVENLWHYTTKLGADLAIFSGGKGLRGPQASGLIVGNGELVRACRENSGPSHSIARPAKVGKEEMAGLLAAVEFALAQDAESEVATWRSIVDFWQAGLRNAPGIEMRQVERSHSGQPIPRLIVDLECGDTRDKVISALWERTPRIAVLSEGDVSLGLNPQAITADESRQVLKGLLEVLSHVVMTTTD